MTDKNKFDIGDLVRVDPTRIDSFVAEIQGRINRGRVGRVSALGFSGSVVFVDFPAEGRRRKFSHRFTPSSLEAA